MTKAKRVITRRDFLRTGSCVALGTMAGLSLTGRPAAADRPKSRVVLVRDEGVIGADGGLDADRLTRMLDQAVTALAGASDPSHAWGQFFKAGDVVGIKTNIWPRLPTPRELEAAVAARLNSVGVAPEDISVDDRGIRSNPVFQRATALVNMRPLRTHHWSGVGTLLKNYIMFVPRPWDYHDRACEPLGSIWNLPQVKDKTRLNVLVMLTPLFHGSGPHHFSKQYTWAYGGLIVSADPVAADATGARILQAKRNDYFGEERPISPPPRHIAAADKTYGVGNSTPERIDLLRLGWREDSLI